MNWYLENGKDSDIIISSRIRLARNVKDFPFKLKMSKEDKDKLLEKVKFVTPSIGYGLKFLYLKDMDDITKMSLVEKHILSPKMAISKEQDGAILINDEENICIMINEEYNIPNLVMKQEKIPNGKYARMRLHYLKENKRAEYTILLMENKLAEHLTQIQTQATEMIEQIVQKLAMQDQTNEELKMKDQMKWTGLMNNYKLTAEEQVKMDLIYN